MKLSSPSGSLISLERLLMHRASFPSWLSSFYILLLHFESWIQLEGRAAIQRELHSLQKQADANFPASNKSNRKVWHPGRNSPNATVRAGGCLEATLPKRSSASSWTTWIWASSVPSQQRQPAASWALLTRGPGKWSFIRIHLSTVSSFGFPPVQEQCWHTGESQSKGLRNGQGLENMMHMKRLRELDIFSLEKNAKGRPCCCLQLPDCRTGLEDGASLRSARWRHKLQGGKFLIPEKRGKKVPWGQSNTGTGCLEKL